MKKIVTTLVLGWVMVFILQFEAFYGIENALTDKLTVKSRPVDPRIKIVAIDSESLDKIGQWPWSRDKLAVVMDKIAAGGATAVWTNVLFTEKSANPEEDNALAQVVAKHDNIFLPVYFDFAALQKSRSELEKEYLKMPVVDIPEERIGHTNVLSGKDGIVREVLLGIPTLEEEIIPGIDIRLANLILPKENKITWDQSYVWERGPEKIPMDETLKTRFSYVSSSKDTNFEIIPIWRVSQGDIDPAHFKDSIVMIGPYADTLDDQFRTPVSKNSMYGVEVHANMTQALVDNALYSKASKSLAMIIVVLAAMIGYLLFDWLKAKLGAAFLAFLLIGYSGLVYYLFHSQALLLPYSYTLFALLLAYVISVAGLFSPKRGLSNKMV